MAASEFADIPSADPLLDNTLSTVGTAALLDPASIGQAAFSESLGTFLLARGLADSRALDRAGRVAVESGRNLAAVLSQLGIVNERALAEAMASLFGWEIARPEDYPAAPVLPDRLKPKFLRNARILPLAVLDNELVIAMADPLDRFAIDAIAAASGCHVSGRIALPIDLEAAFARLYADHSLPAAHADSEGAAIDSADPVEDDAERLKDLASEAPVIRLVNQIISRAVETRASDIHIEPFEDRLRVRCRYDGVLQEVESPPAGLRAAIVSRIKIMAKLDIAERRLPQDGRIKLAVRGNEIDLRVSTIPSLHGETIALRILDRSSVELDFDKLGLDRDTRARFVDLLGRPNGIVLVTGPTGSGKTTTLYTGLLQLNSVIRKVMTVEDPVEYQLPGIIQIQARPQISLTFAHVLRSILRQDPDVIMIGEIRDLETAEIAVQAALTGHLVLSTLHTNSAAASITRLRDMGMEDYLLTATINGVLAQRLVRRLCEHCKQPVPASPELIARFALDRFADAGVLRLCEQVGCPQCRGTGFSGRMAIGELLVPDEAIHRLVLARADQGEIQRAACAAGMRTLYENGLRTVVAGATTLAEMLRSVRAEE